MQVPGLAAVALSVALFFGITPPARATKAAAAAPKSAAATLSTLNFPEAEVDAIARVIAALLDRPILVDPRVKGKMSLYTEQPVTPAQAYALFTASLRGLGFSVVESAGLLKIVPEADAKLQTGTIAASTAADANSARHGGGDPIVTQVIRVTHENANNLVPVLRPLISPNNTINANPGNNTLVITDYASNLARLATIVAALDTPSATDVEVIPLQHALAPELAVTVQRLSDIAVQAGATGAPATAGNNAGTSGSGGSTSIVADAHINALLVRAPNPARLAAIRSLVAKLDLPGASGAGGSNIHVIYLQHVEAVRLASVLRAALPSYNNGDALRGSGSATGGGSSSGGGTLTGTSGSSSGLGSGTTGTTGSGASSQAAGTPVATAAQPSLGGYIQADPVSNSLIVTAPEPLFRQIRAVVDLLDTRRAQLYVESLIVEVDASRALDVGLQWKQIFNISSDTSLTLGTVATALETMAGTNILSTANLVTLDNEEAKIVVGQNVPFVTGSYTSTGSSTTSPFQTIERKDVGLTLRIKPQIGKNGAIRMTILQESSSVSSTSSTLGPTTNKRAIESTVVVNDGKIIVLGGLIENSYESEANHVPLLADVPGLGVLFRSLSRTRKKTNLVVFLRPRVMPDDAATDALSLERYDFIRARQRELPADVHQVLPDKNDMPTLPESPS
ncbi:MAG TPA: secretin N-terminal domain-containing protein [Burkholderiaceae bacterium]